MSLLSMLATTCTLERKSSTKDASGGMTNTFAAVSGYSGIACDIQPASGSVQMRYQQKGTICTHSIYFAEDVPAFAGDRFTTDDSRTFLVMGIRKASPGRIQWPCIVDVEERLA